MTPERWQQVKDVVGRALDTEPADRDALLAVACGDDATLRREVEALVAAAESADSLPGAREAIAEAARAMDRGRVPGADADPALRAVLNASLGQQYDILLPLGRGGMGAVYLARDRALERFVAIKVLRPDLAAAPGSRERFRREARIAAQLAHPGILPLHTFGEVDGVWYFVMGYVRGESLADRLRREGALPAADARRILVELVDALAHAHRHGVVHRDIKPANVLLDEEWGRATLADFGISKLRGADDSLTTTGAVMGTPHFMSPEQAVGAAAVDERSDIYSLGAVGYTMLAGREPFAGETVADLMYQRLTHDPAPLRTLVPNVPLELEAVVMRCLAREPVLRWPDARSLHEALLQADDEPVVLPEAVRDLPGFGPYALVWALGWSALAAGATPGSVDRALLLLIALLVPLGLGLHVWSNGRQGMSPLQLARVACWPPPWWGMWWPRRLRRPGDLWTRLPIAARLARLVVSALFVALPALVLLRQALQRRATGGLADAREQGVLLAEGVLVAGGALVVLGALAWTRRRGLTLGEGAQFLFGATMPSPAWRAARLSTLLRPSTCGVRPPEHDALADHARAIGELAALLPPDGAVAGAAATQAARRLLAAIATADREIATLARDAGGDEVDRLAARLASLDESAAGDALPDRAELRALVQQQLALVRRMQGRHELARRERARLADLLRALWSQLCQVHDAAGSGPAAVAEAAARVQALCADAAQVADGARRVAPGSAEWHG